MVWRNWYDCDYYECDNYVCLFSDKRKAEKYAREMNEQEVYEPMYDLKEIDLEMYKDLFGKFREESKNWYTEGIKWFIEDRDRQCDHDLSRYYVIEETICKKWSEVE